VIDTIDSELLILRRLSPGRILFACAQVSKLLSDWEQSTSPPQGGDAKAVARLRLRLHKTERAAHQSLGLERARQSAQVPASPGDTRKLKVIDSSADRLLGSAHRSLKSNITDFSPTHPRHQAAAALLSALFPQGARAITHLNCVEQLARMQVILSDCAAAHLSPLIQTLGLSDHFNRLADVTRDYATALRVSAVTKPSPTGAQTLDALRNANAHLARVVTTILGNFDDRDDSDDSDDCDSSDDSDDCDSSDRDASSDRRRLLLAPILYQHDAAKRSRKAHGVDSDADPMTGQDLLPHNLG
jgi:hypothetical protein